LRNIGCGEDTEPKQLSHEPGLVEGLENVIEIIYPHIQQYLDINYPQVQGHDDRQQRTGFPFIFGLPVRRSNACELLQEFGLYF